jgi:hypothetical protein
MVGRGDLKQAYCEINKPPRAETTLASITIEPLFPEHGQRRRGTMDELGALTSVPM